MSEPTTPSASPAGWYPANVDGQERYWDGAQWTEMLRPFAGGPTTVTVPAAEPEREAAAKLPWYKRKAIIIPVGVLAGIIVISSIGNAIAGGGRSDDADAKPAVTQTVDEAVDEDKPVEVRVPETAGKTAKEAVALLENEGLEVDFSAAEGVAIDKDNWVVLSTTPAAGVAVMTGDTIVVNVEKVLTEAEKAAAAAEEQRKAAEAAIAAMTLGQKNAVKSAQSYLSYSAFSRAGLGQQLTSEYGEGYPAEDAEFAIVYLEQNGLVDWNAEAAESAKSYLDYSSFSRDGLFEQLTSEYGEGFTADQANYALSQVGY